MPELVTAHVWRPPHDGSPVVKRTPRLDRPCAYMNCRRPRNEHEHGVSGGTVGWGRPQ